MGKLPKFNDPMLLVGTETSDDAAVYQVADDIAIIQTVDFFTPVVDDPYMFGQIAAANALSDIYAMGGEPKLALNIAAFPGCLDTDILGEILRGGADKVKEAGAVLAGGHTITDEEPKYGLCVTGFVNPKMLWKNYGAEEGDALILTKPLGSGIINTAVKADFASCEEAAGAEKIMAMLNKYARDIARKYRVHCCTDVTGFGLAGHSLEMARGSEKTFVINAESIPVLEGVSEYAKLGLIPAGAYRNREFVRENAESTIREIWMEDILYDPQTSGGLLLAIHPGDAGKLIEELKLLGTDCAVIGSVTEKKEKLLVFN